MKSPLFRICQAFTRLLYYTTILLGSYNGVKRPLLRRPVTLTSLPRVPSGGVTLKRRCTYQPSVIYLIVNKLLYLSLSLSLSLSCF